MLSPLDMVEELQKFENVGKLVYKRKRSLKAPANKFVQSTIFQLLASNICEIQVGEDKKAVVKLCATNDYPNYLKDKYWEMFNLI